MGRGKDARESKHLQLCLLVRHKINACAGFHLGGYLGGGGRGVGQDHVRAIFAQSALLDV